MTFVARVVSLVRNLFNRDRIEDELDAEMRAALQLLIDEKGQAGFPPDEARRRALLEFGGVESVKEQVRGVRAGAFVETTLLDIRYAARLLRRNPLFTATAALSLAIGIGATTTIFTVVNGLLLRSADGVARPGTLVDVVRLETGEGPGVSPISYPDYLEVRRRVTTLETVYAYQVILSPARLEVEDSAERVFPGMVSVNYFQALGVRAAVGRLFDAGDREQAGASPFVVLSHRFWTRRFAKDPGVVGRTIRINDYPLTVIGVAAETFRGSNVGAPDAWLPLGMIAVKSPEFGAQMLTSREAQWLMLGARLKPGSSRAQASAEVAALGAALAREYPVASGRGGAPPVGHMWSAQIASPVPYGLRTLVAAFLALLMALVGVVLVIACANVAGVLLARATVRRREIGIRVASGAARSRLIRQLLTETVLLFLLGGFAGLWLARVMTSMLVSLLPEFPVPLAVSVPLDWRVAGFSLLLTLAASLLAGLAPALHASRSDVVTALKDDVDGASERLWLRHGFVVAQVAFSILLVVTAGMLVRALEEMKNADQGFDARGVDVAMIDLSTAGYTEGTGAPFIRDLMARVRSLPGVQVATIADRAPGGGGLMLGGLSVPGVPPPPGMRFFYPNWMLVDAGYFDTLRVPILEGRDFSATDAGGERVVILGRRAAGQYWPGESGIGRLIEVQMAPSTTAKAPATVQMRVVGVVGDLSDAGPPELYVPLPQHYFPALTILARSASDRRLEDALRTAIHSMDPKLPILAAQTLESMSHGPVQLQLRLASTVAASVGAVGLLLAAVGIYGVTAYAVTRRTREIGIRLSLGAGRREVVTMVLRHGMTLVGLGSTVGLLLSLGVGQILAGREFGRGFRVPALDVTTFVGATLLFALVGLIACYVPVRRAARIQAMDALRCE